VAETDPMGTIQSELREGMELPKCRKCGCMKESLESLQASLSSLQVEASSELLANVEHWLEEMQPIKYACLGCDYCFPAVAMNMFHTAFPEVGQAEALSCAFEVSEHRWPAVVGDYYAFCDGPGCPVAVSILASVELAERLARVRPKELCIVGKTETENIGIEKIIRNTVTNPTIRVLLLTGKDPKGHQSGRTLLSLWEKGVDENMKVEPISKLLS
jgi:tetrahydromethanopterin S-methyltransferase subunit A